MKSPKLFSVVVVLLLVAAMITACAPAATPAPAAPAAPAQPAAPPPPSRTSRSFPRASSTSSGKPSSWAHENAAKDFNVDITFEGPETEAMVDKQIEMFQTALDKKPAAICLAAVDCKAFIPLLEKAKAASIPVIGFDSGVDSDIPFATAATDNIAAAAAAADKMAELIGGSGEVAVIAHDQTSRTGIDRVKGFTDQIKAKYPNITIVDTQYGAGDQLKSTDIAKAVIGAHPEPEGLLRRE